MKDNRELIEKIESDAAFVEWRDYCEMGQPYGAVIVGGHRYKLTGLTDRDPEDMTEGELDAELGAALAELKENAGEMLGRAARDLDGLEDYKAQALELERKKFEELQRITDALNGVDDLHHILEELKQIKIGQIHVSIASGAVKVEKAIDRLAEAIRTMGAGP